MVCLHGFTDTWRTWDLVLDALEAEHDVLAPTLAGHAGGPPMEAATDSALADGVERAMDKAGLETAHIVGNSLGGYVALQLAARGRARSVVALAPAGGWPRGHESQKETLDFFAEMQPRVQAAAPDAEALLSSLEGRRAATQFSTVNFEHIPVELLAHQMRGAASCDAVFPMIDLAQREGWSVAAQSIDCPVRIVWGTADQILKWPIAATRFRDEWFPAADWVVLDDVGHLPQLDVPLQTAELILGFTAPSRPAAAAQSSSA